VRNQSRGGGDRGTLAEKENASDNTGKQWRDSQGNERPTKVLQTAMPASELERLMQEREDLARTGMYDAHHPIMVQLERHIEAARAMI
jgi:hypothetical protein